MSTRSQTRINIGDERVLTFYRHCDGYPSGHGCDLCNAIIKSGEDIVELLSLLRLCEIELEPADVKTHGDVEYEYEVTYPTWGFKPEGRDINVRVRHVRSNTVVHEGTPKEVRLAIAMSKF